VDKSPGISDLLATLRRWPAEIGLKSEQRCCSPLTNCTTGHSHGTTRRPALVSAVIDIDASLSPGTSAKRDLKMSRSKSSCTRLPMLWLGFDRATATSGFALPALLVTGGNARTPRRPQRSMRSGGACALVGTKSFGLENHQGQCRAPSASDDLTRST